MSQSFSEQIELNTLAPGQMFEGKFQIISVIGRGGMGVVYQAKHTHMNKLVALKTLMRSVVSDDEESFKRFVQEAQTASSLDHQNIVRIWDFDKTADGTAYLVMEYLGSNSLEDVLSGNAHLELDRFLRISVQICDGLQQAHRKAVVHRDIKPSNIMLVDTQDARDIVKIVDFGMAKLTAQEDQQHLTKTGTIVGTPLFMSPEQCRGLELDHRSDIYSLGCVMYAALSGQVPFRGNSSLDTLYKHATEPPPPFDQTCPGLNIPPRLEKVILKSLQKDPADRQQSMMELRNDISDAILHGGYNAGVAPNSLQPGVHRDNKSTHVDGYPNKNIADQDSLSRTLNISQNPRPTLMVVPEQKQEGNALSKFAEDQAVHKDLGNPTAAAVRRPSPSKVADTHDDKIVLSKSSLTAVGLSALVLTIGAVAFSTLTKNGSPAAVTIASQAPVKLDPAAQTTVAFTPSKVAVKASALSKDMVPAESKNPKAAKSAEPVKLATTMPAYKAKTAIKRKELDTQTSQREALLKQIKSFEMDAHDQIVQKKYGAAELAFGNSIRFKSIAYGASDYRLVPDLAHMCSCELELGNDEAVKRNLLWALKIFNSEQNQVHTFVSSMKEPIYVWRPLARASQKVAEESSGTVRLGYLKWAKGFYELAIAADTSGSDPIAKALMKKQYGLVSLECKNPSLGQHADNTNAAFSDSQKKQSNQKKKSNQNHPGWHTKKVGTMLIKDRR